MMRERFSLQRWLGIIVKEFIQLRRDRLTFGMIIGIPVLQLILFGYAINADPKRLPTAVLSADSSVYSRSLVSALQTSGYFRIERHVANEEELDRLLALGRVQFAVTIPENFGRKLVRGERPVLLVEADASDPSATGNAIAALAQISFSSLNRDLDGSLAELKASPPPVDIRVHRRYNPEGVTAYNIVPGLIGTILTMTMVLMTGLAMTRERERGTMENLLAMPPTPLEVMTGKIVPYVFIGLIQSSIILLAARYLFDVPFVGSIAVLYLVALLFISANLTVGITLSSLAQNQLQAMQLTFFYFLPSILLSGFMFPFEGMPGWAQAVGSVIPTTYFMRAVRGILLKGNDWVDLWPHVWPMLLFTAVVLSIALRFYRKTLD